MKLRNVATIALVIASLAVAAAILLNRRKVKGQDPLPVVVGCPDFEPQYAGKPNIEEGEADYETPVMLGEYSANVAFLQETLNDKYGANLVVDGKAGCDTFDATYELTGLKLSEGIDLNDLK